MDDGLNKQKSLDDTAGREIRRRPQTADCAAPD
jgi:hypothetical protein